MQAEIKIMDTNWREVGSPEDSERRFFNIEDAIVTAIGHGYSQSDDEPLMIGHDDNRGVLAFVFQDAVYRINEENSHKKWGKGNL
jgi:hypothetical protein